MHKPRTADILHGSKIRATTDNVTQAQGDYMLKINSRRLFGLLPSVRAALSRRQERCERELANYCARPDADTGRIRALEARVAAAKQNLNDLYANSPMSRYLTEAAMKRLEPDVESLSPEYGY